MTTVPLHKPLPLLSLLPKIISARTLFSFFRSQLPRAHLGGVCVCVHMCGAYICVHAHMGVHGCGICIGVRVDMVCRGGGAQGTTVRSDGLALSDLKEVL